MFFFYIFVLIFPKVLFPMFFFAVSGQYKVLIVNRAVIPLVLLTNDAHGQYDSQIRTWCEDISSACS